MSVIEHWLLPEGIEEVLPEQAWRLEQVRRELLDVYRSWGYELVIPPMIEFLESLLTGSGNDLDLQTFKLIDQLSGRMMGVRADMTPQAARIDAHQLRREGPARLCYLGTVLHTRPDGFAGSRSPLQVGAELYGHSGLESDLEIFELMLETLAVTGIAQVHVDLGHVGIFRGLARAAGLHADQECELFDALQRKAAADIEALLAALDLREAQRRSLAALATLHGGDDVLDRARGMLGGDDSVAQALDELSAMAGAVGRRWPDLPLHFDLAELRGYAYQTGVVFAAFTPGCGQEIARGGRYDKIGEIFGRARPATGFSADLRTLIALSGRRDEPMRAAILAPADDDPALGEAIRALRARGETVIRALPGAQVPEDEVRWDRELVKEVERWVVRESGQK